MRQINCTSFKGSEQFKDGQTNNEKLKEENDNGNIDNSKKCKSRLMVNKPFNNYSLKPLDSDETWEI